jgi:esterase/lipase superfamily enzyme
MTRWQRQRILATILLISAGGPLVSRVTAAWLDGPQEDKAPEAAIEEATAIKNVEVFFATSRLNEMQDQGGVLLGGNRGEPRFGICRVEFDSIPVMGEIADRMPFYLPTETSDLQVELKADRGSFLDQLAAAVEATPSGDVAVFIHGYKYDFDRSCSRAAEAQRVLEGQSTVVLFTWPSDGDATGYVSDQTDLDWSVPFLERVLQQLADRFGSEHLHVLAHSMGSRGVVEALTRWSADQDSVPLIGRLVLLAPDLDAQTFVEGLPSLLPLAESITLYASGTDTPLKVSHQLNGSPRLGQAGEFLTVAEGMETVDVTPAGRYQYLGHEYFYFHPQVGADLVELVTTGRSGAERSGLRPKQKNGSTYWEVIPEQER